MSRISEIAKEMKTWWGNDGSDIEVQNALDEIIRLDEATDRKTEPQKKEVEWVYNKRERLWYPYSNGELLFKEIPNNCEHITEDGVTCAKYPACDDCLNNPLNKIKGSERLVKGKDGSQTEREGE